MYPQTSTSQQHILIALDQPSPALSSVISITSQEVSLFPHRCTYNHAHRGSRLHHLKSEQAASLPRTFNAVPLVWNKGTGLDNALKVSPIPPSLSPSLPPCHGSPPLLSCKPPRAMAATQTHWGRVCCRLSHLLPHSFLQPPSPAVCSCVPYLLQVLACTSPVPRMLNTTLLHTGDVLLSVLWLLSFLFCVFSKTMTKIRNVLRLILT